MSNYLINTDSNLSGIFRVIIIYKVGDEQSRIFIPGQVVNPLNSDGTLNEAVFEENKLVYPLATWNSKPMRDLIPEDKVLPGWIVYESGDAKRPVIIGYLGKGLDMADEWSIEVVYNYVFGDGTGVDTGEGYIDENGDYVTPVEGATGIVGTAQKYLGVKYVYGGSDPSGFDCSGFTSYVYGQNGISIPRTAAVQYKNSTKISKSELTPGCLVFFTGSRGSVSNPGHVGIYIGNGQFIHSPRPGKGVEIGNLNSAYYQKTYVGAGKY